MNCSKCGSQLKEGAKFCSKCGEKVGENSDLPKKKSSLKTVIIITCIVLPVSLLGVGGVIAHQKREDNTMLSLNRDRKERRTEREKEDREETEEEMEEHTEEETESAAETALTEETEMETEMATEPSIPEEAATAAMPTLAGQGSMPYGSVQGTNAAVVSSEYILPESSSRLLTYTDIAGLTKEQLRLARNEIYARHGRLFTTDELQNYFNGKSWYRGTISASVFSESMLSQIEKDNIKLIQQREDLFQ